MRDEHLPPALQQRLAWLPLRLQEHIGRVRVLAAELAALHTVDELNVDLAAAAHDLARSMKPDKLLEEARRLGLPVSPVEVHAPILLHGPIAARWIEDDLPDLPPEVVEAVRVHTTGKPGMDAVARVVFLADKLEPNKLERRPDLQDILDNARCDLDRALLAYLDRETASRIRNGDLVHPQTLALRNELTILFIRSDKMNEAII